MSSLLEELRHNQLEAIHTLTASTQSESVTWTQMELHGHTVADCQRSHEPKAELFDNCKDLG